MKLLPAIHLYKKEIHDKRTGKVIPLNTLFDIIPSDEKVYVYDQDGIEKDKPNLYLYQKLSERYDLWIDSSPRVLGDVVDMLMAGATALTIRQDAWKNIDISSIKEITENDVFLYADCSSTSSVKPPTTSIGHETGVVLFINESDTRIDFCATSYLAKVEKRGCKLYVYDLAFEHIKYWKHKQIMGLITELPHWQKVKKNGL